jgi:LuxR family maltose regulon positive regulatory protein
MSDLPLHQRALARTVLAKARSKPINLIIAPVASGKTELLEDVAGLAEESGQSVFRLRPSADTVEAVARLLEDAVALKTVGDHRSVLLIDDIHRLDRVTAAAVFEMFQDSSSLVLIAAGDRPTAAPIAALRIRRVLAEYGLPDLALTRHEARRLTRINSADSMSRDFQLLMQSAEGWLGAWRLIAERLHSGESIRRVAADFHGSAIDFADFFEEEILFHLTPEVKAFVVHYGVLSPLSVELAEFLAGAPGRQLWDEARRQCAFFTLAPGAGRGLSPHPMFRRFLAERAMRTDPEAYVDTLRRAASWFEARRDWPEVIECLLAAGDETDVGETLRQNASEIFLRYGDITLLLGRGFVSERLVRELAPAIRPEAALIQRRLAAEGALQSDAISTGPIVDEFRVILTYFSGDRFDALRPRAEAWLQKETQDPIRRALVAVMLSAAYHSELDARGMRQALELGSAEIAKSESPFVETWIALEWALYHLDGARPATSRLAIETVLERPAVRGLMRNTLEMVLAAVEYRLGRLSTASDLIDRSLAPGTRHADPDTMVLGWTTAAQCALKNSGLEEALSILDGAYAVVARRAGERGRLLLRLAACQLCLQSDPRGRLAFVRSELDQIQANAAPLALGKGFHEEVRMVYARLLYEQGEFREATSLIQPILRRTEGTDRVQRWAEASLLRAAIATAEGRSAVAARIFWDCEAATTDAAIRQLFFDEAKLLRPTIGHLMQQVESSGFEPRHRALVKALASASGAAVSDAVATDIPDKPTGIKLTRVERRVVEFVAKGLSNQEISDRMSCSVATVKWHLGNVYIKLDVRSRTAALNRLQTLNLLS